MHLKLNANKLTPIDMQVLTMAGLVGASWRIDDDTIEASDLGYLVRRMLIPGSGVYGMQFRRESPSSRYRKLSWRGQRLMYQWLQEQLQAPIDIAQKETEAAASHNLTPSLSVSAAYAEQRKEMLMREARIAGLASMQNIFRDTYEGAGNMHSGGVAQAPPSVVDTDLTKFLTGR